MISYIAVLLHKNNIITLSLWLCLFFSFLFSWLHYDRVISLRKQDWYWILTKLLTFFFDQYQHLGNCPPTPPLTQQQVRGGLWGSCPDIDIDPFFLLFFSSCFKNPLSWLRSGDKEACVLLSISKSSSDEEHQTIDLGARDNTNKLMAWHCLRLKSCLE